MSSCACRRLPFSLSREGPRRRPVHSLPLDNLLLRNRALARALAGAGVGLGALAAHRQVAAVPQPAEAADLHQPLDVHGDVLAQVTFHAALLLDHLADVPDVVFGQILDADVGADPGRLQNRVRAEPSDAIDIGETNLDALGPREINACNSRHSLIPAAACVSGSSKSPAPRRGAGRSCTCRRFSSPTLVLSCGPRF